MTFRQRQAARSDKRLEALAAKVAAPGEFIHLTAAGLPRMASGQPVSRGALKKLVAREIVAVVQTDLIGRPMQYRVPVMVVPPSHPLAGVPCVIVSGKLPVGRRWSKERRDSALAFWISGDSKAAVARKFGTSRGFIVRMARVDKWPATR